MYGLIEPATVMLAAFRFKGPPGIQGAVFWTILGLVAAGGVVYAVRHLRTGRSGPPLDDRQDRSGRPGEKDRSPWR